MSYIITSLLDTDFYKFTMGQLVFHRYKDIPVKYAFINRTSGIPLADLVSEEDLRRELDHVRTLRFNNSDLHYLRGTNEYSERMFKEDYLQFLKTFELPPYRLMRSNSSYFLEFSGKWSEAIYWETFALSIMNELYCRAKLSMLSRFDQETVYAEGKMKLAWKIRLLREHGRITFCDFGTRRRFSNEWHDSVVRTLTEEMSARQFLGTSNVYLAMKYGLMPMGTSAHELFMVMSGIMHGSDEEIRASHKKVLQDWWDEYGWGLSIYLPDTYGTDFGLRDFEPYQAAAWKGVRQDSGDPYVFGEFKVIPFYRGLGIDLREKIIVFSDGLEETAMIKLHDHFSGRVRCTFGWGTNLTNDFRFSPLSLIVKPVKACGHGVVKLSDNIAKATGKPKDIELFKKIFGYTNTYSKACRT